MKTFDSISKKPASLAGKHVARVAIVVASGGVRERGRDLIYGSRTQA